MSRSKKSRSLKRVNGGVKTGTKERTKIERKRRKEAKKEANPRKNTRQKSQYQKFLDENNLVEKQHVAKPATQPEVKETQAEPVRETPKVRREPKEENLWDMLEKPNQTDTF